MCGNIVRRNRSDRGLRCLTCSHMDDTHLIGSVNLRVSVVGGRL
ncbi:MAG: hypothetical protein KIY11_09195 [Thermoplasmata archaeon]|nr:hypothetical protein [Candidatus Sysuiplasma acidicola]